MATKQKIRAVGVLRISVETDESTSIEKQKSIISAWALVRGAEIIDWAVDEGVSGATSPFDRDGLGPWLTDERSEEYDILVGWKLDRFGRKTREFLQLVDWLHSRKKDIAITDINIDTTTPGGRMILTVLAAYAEWERSMIADRVTTTHKHLRGTARLGSGKGPWWTNAVKRSDGWYLENDSGRVGFMQERLIRPRLARHSYAKIARDAGVGGPARVAALLTPERLMGWKLYTPSGEPRSVRRIARDENGDPIQYHPPLITLREFHELKALQTGKKETLRGTTERLMLRGIAVCGHCERAMVKGYSVRHGKRYEQYQHAAYECGKGRFSIAKTLLDDYATAPFMDLQGEQELVEKVFVPGNDVADEIARTTRTIEELREEHDLGLYEGDRDGYLSRMKRLVARRQELEQQPARKDGWELAGTGKTYSEWWESASAEERGAALQDLDMRVRIFVQEEQPTEEQLPTVSSGEQLHVMPLPRPPQANKSYRARWAVTTWRKPE